MHVPGDFDAPIPETEIVSWQHNSSPSNTASPILSLAHGKTSL
jgi:hypothetical protein